MRTHIALVAIAVGLTAGCAGRGIAQAQPPLTHLTDEMLIRQNSVPPLQGSTWGVMVAVPQGAMVPVSPADCAVFLSQGEASQKGLALRSSNGTAIGAELAIDGGPRNLGALAGECRSFTFDGGATQSRVDMETLDTEGLPVGAVRVRMHCQSIRDGQTDTWDTALVAGYDRGVLVSAEYTPGPVGGPFDEHLAERISDIYRAQVARLNQS